MSFTSLDCKMMTGDDDMPEVIVHLSPFGWANCSPTWGVVTHMLEVGHMPQLHRWVCAQVEGFNVSKRREEVKLTLSLLRFLSSIILITLDSMSPEQTGGIELTTWWWLWVKRLTTLSRKRAPSPRRTRGGRVKASVLARGRRGSQQQGCEKKMKRGKRIFSRVSAAGNPAPRAPGLWTDTPLRLVVPDKISRLFQGQQLQRTEESPPLETHLTASECVACCRPRFLSFCV